MGNMPNNIVKIAALAVGGVLLYQLGKQHRSGKTASLEESIEVEIPVSAAYGQWARFEDYPQFMENVHEVRVLDERHLHWRAGVDGKEKQWNAEIVEQIPYMRIAWRNTRTGNNAAVVSFQKISDTTTKITLQMAYVVEQHSTSFEAVQRLAKASLKNFKALLEPAPEPPVERNAAFPAPATTA